MPLFYISTDTGTRMSSKKQRLADPLKTTELQQLLRQFQESGRSILTINGMIAANSFGRLDSIAFSISAIRIAARVASQALEALEHYPAWSEETATTDYLGVNSVIVALVSGLLRLEGEGKFELLYLLHLLSTFTNIIPATLICGKAMMAYKHYLTLPVLQGSCFERDTRTLGLCVFRH